MLFSKITNSLLQPFRGKIMPKKSNDLTPEDKKRIVELVQKQFLKLVRIGLNDKKAYERVNKLKRKCTGLPNDALCDILIRRAKRKTTSEGVASGAIITGCEATIPATGGGSSAPALAAVTGFVLVDVTYTTNIQMKLITDIAQLYECPFSRENEEDVWLIFKCALGLKGTEKVGGYVRFVFTETARKQFRKLLRTGIRRALQKEITKIAGQRIGRYLGEKYVLRLIPVANAFLGGYFNNTITKSVGKWAKVKAKVRSSAFRQIDLLNELNTKERHLILPLIFAVGTIDDKITDNILSLYVQSQERLNLSEEQIRIVEELVNEELLDDRLKSVFSSIQNEDAKCAFLDIAIISAAVNITPTEKQIEYLVEIANWLGSKFERKKLEDKVKYLKR